MMNTIIIDDIAYTIQYRATKIGDRVVNTMSNTIYTATIFDADDLNWIVVTEAKVSDDKTTSRQSRIEKARDIAGEIYALYCPEDKTGSWELNKATDAIYAYIKELEELPPKD